MSGWKAMLQAAVSQTNNSWSLFDFQTTMHPQRHLSSWAQTQEEGEQRLNSPEDLLPGQRHPLSAAWANCWEVQGLQGNRATFSLFLKYQYVKSSPDERRSWCSFCLLSSSFLLYMNTYPTVKMFYLNRCLYANLRRLMEKQNGLRWRDWEKTSPPINWTTSSKKGKTVVFSILNIGGRSWA